MMELALAKPFFADDVPGGYMQRNELQMRERGVERSAVAVQRAEREECAARRERMEGMSLESLLYYVLVGDGRRMKESARG